VRYDAAIMPEHIHCDGCRSEGRKFFYCSDLCEIRKCGVAKELDHCAACDQYACEKLEALFQVAPEARTALDALRPSA